MDGVFAGAQLGALDLGVVALYIVGTIALGIFATRRKADAQDYFLASREASWPVIGLALLASNISSMTLIGLAGAAYGIGISVYNYEWSAAAILVVFCLFVLPSILRSRVYTMPEFLERRYDGRARTWFAAITLFLNLVLDTAGTLYGGSLVIRMVYPAAPIELVVLLLALAAGLYTIAGGLRAVLYTEVVQAVVLLGGACLVMVFAFDKAGGWDAVMAGVDPAKLSLVRPNDDPGVPWFGLLTGIPILGFYFWCTNQFMVQRVLSAKSLDHGRWGSLFAGLLKLSTLFLMVLPGTAAVLLYPSLERADLVYPTLVFDLLPVGILGLVVAGFLAALMSSVSSVYNSAATLFTMDFMRRWKPDMSSRGLVTTGRIATLVFMTLSVLWAPQIANFESLWQYLQAVLGYVVPPVVALFIGGLFWGRANARGAMCAIVVGGLSGAALFIGNVITGAIAIHFLIVAAIIFAASLAALVAGSFTAPPPPEEKVRDILWRREIFAEETIALRSYPWWKNYRVLAMILLALTAAQVIWFF